MRHYPTIPAAFLLAGLLIPVAARDFDLVLSSEHTLADYSITAMAGSGIAIERGIGSCLLNPALPNAYARGHDLKLTTVSAGYGRDNVFTTRIVPLGFSLTIPNAGTVGFFGRDLSAGEKQNEYEAVASFSGRLFENNLNQGPVDVGINVRYERTHWMTSEFDTLHSVIYGLSGSSQTPDSVLSRDTSFFASGDLQQERVMIDIGFYQARIADYVDFALVVHNAFGYVWHKELPDTLVMRGFEYDSVAGPSGKTLQPVKYDSINRYEKGVYAKAKGWIPQQYRGISAGIAYRTTIFDDKVNLTIPVDLEIGNFFSGITGMHFMVRTGFEAKIGETYFLRFGYARAPREYLRGESAPKGTNIVTGGAGVKLSVATVDFNIGKDEWGLGIGFAY